MNKNNTHQVEVQMLIRKPVSEVFRALLDPAITTHFWFTRSSGILAPGKTLTWHWDMYKVSAEVQVKEVIPDQKISIQWGDPLTTVDFEFTAVTPESTYVIIKNHGFTQTGDALIHALTDNTGGFIPLLDGMKAYLEHGIELNLVKDKFLKEVKNL